MDNCTFPTKQTFLTPKAGQAVGSKWRFSAVQVMVVQNLILKGNWTSGHSWRRFTFSLKFFFRTENHLLIFRSSFGNTEIKLEHCILKIKSNFTRWILKKICERRESVTESQDTNPSVEEKSQGLTLLKASSIGQMLWEHFAVWQNNESAGAE